MQRSHKLIAVIVTTCLTCGVSIAGTQELSRAVFESSKYGQTYITREERDVFADEVLRYWEDLTSRIPLLSPQEKEWLMTEISGDPERINRAIRSKEYSLDQAGRIANNCVAAAKGLVDKRTEYIAMPNMETFGWIKVARCYTQSGDLADFLVRAGLSDGQADDSYYMMLNSMILERVIDSVTISSLADAEGWSVDSSEP